MKKRISLCLAAIVIAGCASVDSRNTGERPWNQPSARNSFINWWPCVFGLWGWESYSRFEQEQWFNTYGR